jgi:hypothetical protein
MDDELERNARNLLRPDNYDLFEQVRLELNARNPVIPIDDIASRLCVSVDDLCRWVIGFKEAKRKAPYQSPVFAPLRPPKVSGPDVWADDEARRRQKFAQKARDGARATILALEKADG